MSIFNQFPWTNFREYNLDWVIKTLKSVLADLPNDIAKYFADHIDTTLTKAGEAADAAAVGNRLLTMSHTLANQGGRIGTLEENIIYVYRFTNTGGTLSANAGVNVMDIIHDWQNHDPVMIMIDDLPAYNLDIHLQTGYNDRWIISGDHVSGSFTYETYTNTGSISIVPGYEYHQVVLRHNGGTWSYAKGNYDAADKVLKGVVGSDPTLDNVGSIWYQQSLTDPLYALVTCKLNSSYLPVAAWDLKFYKGSGTEVSVTIKSDGTFV